MIERTFATLASAALLAGTLLACTSRTPSSPATLDESGLRVGQERQVPGSQVFLQMIQVGDDSRCPIDVTCVWEGNAAVTLGLRVGSGPTTAYVLNTTSAPRSVTAFGFTVRLDSLLPAPRSTRTIGQGDYVAYLKVSPPAP